MLLNSIPSPESSFGTLRMLLEKTIPCGVPTTAIQDSSLIPRKTPRATSLRLGPVSWTVPGKYLFRPRHISTRHSRTTVGSAKSCHSIGSTVRCANYSSNKSCTPYGSDACDLPIVTPCNSPAKQINVRTFSFTILTPLSACPADLLSYAWLVLCIVLTLASLSFSPTLRLNATIGTVSLNDYFRITQSQNPLGCCLNWKFVFNSFAAHTVCINHCAFCPESLLLSLLQ